MFLKNKIAWMDRSQFIVLFDSGINNKDYIESYSLFTIINDVNNAIDLPSPTLETYNVFHNSACMFS